MESGFEANLASSLNPSWRLLFGLMALPVLYLSIWIPAPLGPLQVALSAEERVRGHPGMLTDSNRSFDCFYAGYRVEKSDRDHNRYQLSR